MTNRRRNDKVLLVLLQDQQSYAMTLQGRNKEDQPLRAVLSSNDYKGKHILIALLMYRKTIGQRFCTYPKITTI